MPKPLNLAVMIDSNYGAFITNRRNSFRGLLKLFSCAEETVKTGECNSRNLSILISSLFPCSVFCIEYLVNFFHKIKAMFGIFVITIRI